MLALAQYSRACLEQLRADTGIQYDQRMKGTLQLFRTQKQLDGTAADIAVLKRFDVDYELLDRAGCIAAEPALAHVADKIMGGLRLTGDETGDCFLFTRALAALAKDARRGISLRQQHHRAGTWRIGHRVGRDYWSRRPEADRGRCLRDRDGQLFAAAGAAAGASPAGLSRQGLFAHPAGRE